MLIRKNVQESRDARLVLPLESWIICLLSIMLFSMCHKTTPVEKDLLKADSLIMENPDSAFVILEGIDTVSLKAPKDRALYGLLMTMAMDKKHLNPKDENIILPAIQYYNKKGDKENLLRATHYYGRVLYLKKDFSNALINFYKAKELAEKTNDYFYAGLACRGISDIFHETSSSSDELIYARKEFDYFQRSKVQPYINYALLDLCTSTFNGWKEEETSILLENLLDSAIKYNDENLYGAALSLKAKNLIWDNHYEQSFPLLEKRLSLGDAEAEDSLYYSWNLIELGRVKEGEEILDLVSPVDKPYENMIRYKINRRTGNIKNALTELELMFNNNDKNTKVKKDIILSSYLADYFELNKKLDESEIQTQKFKLWLIILCSLFAIIILISIIVYLKNKSRKEIEKRINIIEDLNKSLENNQAINMKSFEVIDRLFKSQHQIIAEIGEIYRFNPQTGKARKKVEEKIDALINDFSINGKLIPEMEAKVNEVYDNLFADFRTDFPDLKDLDYLLYLYSIYGFSNSAIAIFIHESRIESIYNRKRRLKDKINKLDEEKRERYFSFF